MHASLPHCCLVLLALHLLARTIFQAYQQWRKRQGLRMSDWTQGDWEHFLVVHWFAPRREYEGLRWRVCGGQIVHDPTVNIEELPPGLQLRSAMAIHEAVSQGTKQPFGMLASTAPASTASAPASTASASASIASASNGIDASQVPAGDDGDDVDLDLTYVPVEPSKEDVVIPENFEELHWLAEAGKLNHHFLDMIDHEWWQGPPAAKRVRRTIQPSPSGATRAKSFKLVQKVHLKKKHVKASSRASASPEEQNVLECIDEMSELKL